MESKDVVIMGTMPENIIKKCCESSDFKLQQLTFHSKQENGRRVILKAFRQNDSLFSFKIEGNLSQGNEEEISHVKSTSNEKKQLSTKNQMHSSNKSKQSVKRKCYRSGSPNKRHSKKSRPECEKEPYTIQTRSTIHLQHKLEDQRNNPVKSLSLVKFENTEENASKRNEYVKNLQKYQPCQRVCSHLVCSHSVTSVVGGSFAIRAQELNRVASELGLKFRSLVDNLFCTETFHFFSIKKSPTRLSLNIVNINRSISGREIAILEYSHGERGNGILRWPFCEFTSFIWAFRGVCNEAFFLSMREQLGFPQIQEPEEPYVEELACQNAENNFSILEIHRELRLEELANDLVLNLQKSKTHDGKNELIFKESKPKTKFQLHFIETGNIVNVTTKILKEKYLEIVGIEHWPKLTRSYFRFAVLGKAMKIFYQK